jgi:hypothetical protein
MKLYIQNIKDKRIKNHPKAEYNIPSDLTPEKCEEIEIAINDWYNYNFYVDHPGRSVLIDDYKNDILSEIEKYKFMREFSGDSVWSVLADMKNEIEELKDELSSIKSTFRNAFGCKKDDYYD